MTVADRASRSRWVGWLAIVAAPVTVAGLVVGISLVDWDAEAYRDPAVVLALGDDKAAVLRVSYLLTALGSYAMLVPLLAWLRRRLPDTDAVRGDVTALAGFVYLLLGAALDGIPESLIIGLSLVAGGAVELAFLVSVAVSNVPESFASASARRVAGVPVWRILSQWLIIVAVSALFGAIGFAVFDELGPWAVAFTQSFGAGALLTMVMDTMAPEAFRDAGPVTGLVSVAGFAFAFYVGTL